MSVISFTLPLFHADDSNGLPLVGGKLFTYAAGTTTKQNTYTDQGGGAPNLNPTILNARGEAQVWTTVGLNYKFVLAPATDTDPPTNAIWSIDNLTGGDSLRTDLANTSSVSLGDALVGVKRTEAGAGATTLHAWIQRAAPTPFDFGAVGDGITDDGAALEAFLTAGLNGAMDFGFRGTFLSNRKLTCQARRCNWRGSKIKFNIPNHTDNCLTLVAVGTLSAEDGTRFYHQDLVIDANITGLDALYIAHGSPIIDGIQIFNSYRDSIHVHPKVTLSQWIENMTITNILQQGTGRHPMHIYIECDGVNGTFVNDSFVSGWEIRSFGVRFANSNALRFTYDNVALASQTKVGTFNIFNAAWDCDQAASLAGSGIGNPIYHDCINGSTLNGSIEALNCWKTSGESTSTAVAGKKFLDASYTINSTHFAQCSLHVSNYQWFTGVPDGFLASYGNSFRQNVIGSGLVIEVLGSRPTGFLLYGDGTDGNAIGYMDAASIKNAPAVWVDEKDMVASANITFVIPIKPLSDYAGIGVDWAETAIEVSLQNWGRVNDETYRYRATWEVTPCRSAGGTAYCYNELVHSQAGADLTRGFTAANVTFAVTSSSGSLQNQVTVTVPGGANVGAAGLSKITTCIAKRKHGVYEPPLQVLKGITAI